MLQTMILSIVVIPLALGIVAALAGNAAGGRKAGVIALLIPLFAVAALIGIDGWPTFPPVRAAHKFPYVLTIGGVLFGVAALVHHRRNAALTALAALASIALPMWWMGRTILANNPQKAAVLAIIAVLTVAGAFWQTARQPSAAPETHVLPQAFFATSIAAALVAIFGGYMGMAMFNGALAALSGGFLLVTYIRYLRGEAAAFALPAGAGLAFGWVVLMGVAVTALSAPKASAAALIATTLTLVLTPLSSLYGPRLASLPHAARPLANGLAAALPALAGIAIAALQFAG